MHIFRNQLVRLSNCNYSALWIGWNLKLHCKSKPQCLAEKLQLDIFPKLCSPTASARRSGARPSRRVNSAKTFRQWPEMVVKLPLALTINCRGLLFFLSILTYSWDAICQMTVSASSAAANWQSWRCHERTFGAEVRTTDMPNQTFSTFPLLVVFMKIH